MRHGIAARADGGGSRNDRERPLTEAGTAEVRLIGRGLAAAGMAVDRIFSSPLVRARETARIMAETHGGGAEIQELEELTSGLVPAALFRALRTLPASSRVLLVGHEPDMGLLAATLLGLPESRAIPFKTGGAARIDVDRMPPSSPGVLIWMIPPAISRSLAS